MAWNAGMAFLSDGDNLIHVLLCIPSFWLFLTGTISYLSADAESVIAALEHLGII